MAHVRGEGCVWGVECQGVGDQAAAEVANACVRACYRATPRASPFTCWDPSSGKVLRVSPPLVMSLEEAERYLEAMLNIFRDLGQQIGA